MSQLIQTNPFKLLMERGEFLLNASVGNSIDVGRVGSTLRIVIKGVDYVDQNVVMVPGKDTTILFFGIDGNSSFHGSAALDEGIQAFIDGIELVLKEIKETGKGMVELVHNTQLVLPDGKVIGEKETITKCPAEFLWYGSINADEAYESMRIRLSNTLSNITQIKGETNDAA